MKEKGKIYYDAPTATVVDIAVGRIVCSSNVEGKNTINDWENGGTVNDEIVM